MWLSQILTQENESVQAEHGTVMLNTADGMETEGTAKARHLTQYAPYGYQAKVPVGEEVLLLAMPDGIAAAGTRAVPSPLPAGEIEITSAGGASLLLRNDGCVVINHTLVIDKEGQIHYGNSTD